MSPCLPARAPRRAPAHRAVVVATAAALLTVAAPARAQTPPAASPPRATPPAVDPATSAAAREAFLSGTAAMREHRFADAVAAFERSYQLRAVPVALYNLGIALRAQGRVVASVDALERFVAAPDDRTTPAELAELRAEIARLRSTFARVTFAVQPAQATVRVDGRVAAVTAGSPLVLDPGTHVLEAEAAGYRTSTRELRLDAGASEAVTLALASLDVSGRLRVEASVATARIAIDGQHAGTGQVERPLPPGEHVVEIRANGYEPFRRPIRVRPTGVVRLDAALTPTRSPAAIAVPVALGAAAVAATAIALGVYFGTQTSAIPTPLGNTVEPR